VAVDGALGVERFKLPIVLEPILEHEDLDGEPQDLGVVRLGGGLDVGSAPGELLLLGLAARQLQVDEGVLLDASQAPTRALQALDLALGLAHLAGVVRARRL
jgi:hypothetical protein